MKVMIKYFRLNNWVVISMILILSNLPIYNFLKAQDLTGVYTGSLKLNKHDSLRFELTIRQTDQSRTRGESYQNYRSYKGITKINSYFKSKKYATCPTNIMILNNLGNSGNQDILINEDGIINYQDNQWKVIQQRYCEIHSQLHISKLRIVNVSDLGEVKTLEANFKIEKELFTLILELKSKDICPDISIFNAFGAYPVFYLGRIDRNSISFDGKDYCANFVYSVQNNNCDKPITYRIEPFQPNGNSLVRLKKSNEFIVSPNGNRTDTFNICFQKYKSSDDEDVDFYLLVDNKNKFDSVVKVNIPGFIMIEAKKPGYIESALTKKNNFPILIDSINTALQNLSSKFSDKIESFTYSIPGIIAKDQMQGRVLDEFTRVEISGWTTYQTEECGWPLSPIDKDWKAIEFYTRYNLTSKWSKMCYRRILFRIEVCGGTRYLTMTSKADNEPIIEKFNGDLWGSHETFSSLNEATKFSLNEMRKAIPYPVEGGYSKSGNYYADKRNAIIKLISDAGGLNYDEYDQTYGAWLDETDNKIYFIGPANSNLGYEVSINYTSLFMDGGANNAVEMIKNIKVSNKSIEYNLLVDMFNETLVGTRTLQIKRLDKNHIYFSGDNKWTRVGSSD